MRTRINDHQVFCQVERETDQTKTGDDQFRFLRIAESENAAASAIRCHSVEVPFDVECQSLRTAQTCEESSDFAARRNPIDRIKARCRWSGDIKVVIETECQMVRRDARFERRENENLPARADLENAAASIADVQIAVTIERDAGGDAHAFDVRFGSAGRIHR